MNTETKDQMAKVMLLHGSPEQQLEVADYLDINTSDKLKILMIALKKLHESYDGFISACLTEDGKPKAPDYKSLMKARGMLPGSCKNALERKV